MFPLHLFPHGLESNLLVPVLLGVLVNLALTEAWGWDFVGVVVPGYLSAVALVQPGVALVVLLEAGLTYALARALDAAATRAGVWYPVFGRDRFYFILVVSVFARLLFEGAAPAVLTWGARAWPRLGDFRGETFGIGLVLVPLTANRFWRAGLRAGLFQLGVEVTAVRLLLALLIVASNYSLSGFELGFDRLALAFFASPLTQLTLLLTAAIASDFNRRFGWDSHGIMVPALLALVVTAPIKLGATLAEAAIITGAVLALVRLPWMRHANLEGARRVVLCFVIGFALKLAIAAVVGAHAPGYRATDLFGFGYLLPALLAERILAKANLPLVIVPTAQVALLGMPLAAGLGLVLVWLSPAAERAVAAPARAHFATLSQAVAAHAAALRAPGASDATELARRLAHGEATADTGDGYEVSAAAGVRAVLARPQTAMATAPVTGAAVPVIEEDVTDEAAVDAAAGAASRGRALLIIAAPGAARASALALMLGAHRQGPPARAPAPVADSVVTPGVSLRAALAGPARVEAGVYAPPPPAPARDEATFRIARDRARPAALARALRPLGLAVTVTSDGHLLLEGAGWPAIVLREPRPAGVTPVIVAPHAAEVGSAGAAVAALELLDGDAVLARTGGPLDASTASALGVTLASAQAAPLLLVRGTTFGGGGDVLVLSEPAPAGPWPAWMERLGGALRPRFADGTAAPEAAASLRAFPAGTASLRGGAAILWMSPRARGALAAGAEPFGRPDFVALAQARGVPVVRQRLEAWLGASTQGPGPAALDGAERLARSGDPAMLVGHLDGAHTAIIVDDERAVAGVGVSSPRGRAVALGGDRWERRSIVRSPNEVDDALRHGVRTLIAGATP